MAQSIRCFVAVPLDDDVIEAIADVSSRLRGMLDVPLKWVSPAAMHITVKFLGDVPVSQLLEVTDVVRDAAADADPFPLPPRGLGAFPSPRRPRTLIVSLDDPGAKMSRVAARVEAGVKKLGYPPEGRRFSAHITLARAPRDGRVPSVEGAFAATDTDGLREVWVDQLWVMQSELTPRGAVYTPMAKLRFAEG